MLVAQPWPGNDGQRRSAHFVKDNNYDDYDDDDDYVGDNDSDDADDDENGVSGVDWRLCAGEEGVAGDWGAGNYTGSHRLISFNNNNNNNNTSNKNNNDNNTKINNTKNNSNIILTRTS